GKLAPDPWTQCTERWARKDGARTLDSLFPIPYSLLLHFQIVVRLGGEGGSPPLGQQIAAQEGLQKTVKNLIHVAHLDLGAVVLGDAVGLQYIGPDLRAEVYLQLRVLKLLAHGLLLFKLIFVQPRP